MALQFQVVKCRAEKMLIGFCQCSMPCGFTTSTKSYPNPIGTLQNNNKCVESKSNELDQYLFRQFRIHQWNDLRFLPQLRQQFLVFLSIRSLLRLRRRPNNARRLLDLDWNLFLLSLGKEHARRHFRRIFPILGNKGTTRWRQGTVKELRRRRRCIPRPVRPSRCFESRTGFRESRLIIRHWMGSHKASSGRSAFLRFCFLTFEQRFEVLAGVRWPKENMGKNILKRLNSLRSKHFLSAAIQRPSQAIVQMLAEKVFHADRAKFLVWNTAIVKIFSENIFQSSQTTLTNLPQSLPNPKICIQAFSTHLYWDWIQLAFTGCFSTRTIDPMRILIRASSAVCSAILQTKNGSWKWPKSWKTDDKSEQNGQPTARNHLDIRKWFYRNLTPVAPFNLLSAYFFVGANFFKVLGRSVLCFAHRFRRNLPKVSYPCLE